MEDLTFHLDSFDGPLDLLLKLITKNKVDILDIPIALILDQYMEYVELMQRLDMDVAGEFIAMASELMLIKSRMLLPRKTDEESEDPRADLAAALLEYKRMKEAATLIAESYRKYSARLPKDTENIPPDETLYDQPPELLLKAFKRMAVRNRDAETEVRATGETLGSVISTQPASIPGRIIGVMRMLYRRQNGITFEEILCTARTRSELVATFMAILELMRVKRILLYLDGVECTDTTETDPDVEYEISFRLNLERAVE